MLQYWRRIVSFGPQGGLVLPGLPCAILVSGLLCSSLSRGTLTGSSVGAALAVLGCFLFAYYFPRKGDRVLLFTVFTLVAVGWVMLERLDPSLALKQTIWLVLGVAVRAATPDSLLSRFGSKPGIWVAAASAVLLQVAVFLVGTEKHGAKNWVMVGSFSTQPGEFSRLFLILFLAALFCRFRNWLRVDIRVPRYRLPHPSMFLMILTWGLVEVTFVAQKDLGMALLTGLVFLAMFYVATGRIDVVAACLILGGVGSGIAYATFPHVRERFVAWLEPFSDPLGTGYQSVQAIYAVASGGLWGRGLARGEPDLIPAASTDFMTAALSEEFGWAGLVAIVLLLGLVVARAFQLSLRSDNEFSAFLAFGLGTSFAAQIFLVTGGCLRLIPLTGLTLPFLSYGGSSLLASFFAMILLEKIHIEQEAAVER